MLEPNKITKRKMVAGWVLNHGEWVVLVANKLEEKRIFKGKRLKVSLLFNLEHVDFIIIKNVKRCNFNVIKYNFISIYLSGYYPDMVPSYN